MTDLHVMPRRGQWAVIRSGASRAVRLFRSSADAWGYATERSSIPGVKAYRHDAPGRIVERRV